MSKEEELYVTINTNLLELKKLLGKAVDAANQLQCVLKEIENFKIEIAVAGGDDKGEGGKLMK